METVERADSQDVVQEVVLREGGVDDLTRPQLAAMFARDLDAAASGVVVQEFQVSGIPQMTLRRIVRMSGDLML